MPIKFDIAKATEKAKFTLAKRQAPKVKAAVVLNLDVSGSARPLFNSGQMQAASQLVVPLAVLFDDNGELDVFTFASGDDYTTKISPNMTAANYADYIQSKILNARIPLWGGTDYTPVLRSNLKALGFIKDVTTKGGFFSKGTTSEQMVSDNGSGYPALIITFTDGANSDHARTHAFLKECEDNKVNAYFLFVGIGTADFSNIVQYGDARGNVGFVSVKNLEQFAGSDDIYEQLLPEELTRWFTSVKA